MNNAVKLLIETTLYSNDLALRSIFIKSRDALLFLT